MGDMNATLSRPEQERLVYDAICAVAAHCDGAVSRDVQGFNGQDTKFGRRIASVPFSAWTPEVADEAAHIVLKYREQVLRYTGIDVGTLDIVREAQDHGTNYAGRDMARTFERRSKAAALVEQRKVDFDGKLFSLSWAKGDPDFSELLSSAKSLPGRSFNWDRMVNLTPRSPELEDWIQTWDFPLTDRARAALSEPAAPVVPKANITLSEDGAHALVSAPYNAERVASARQLPGRWFDRARRVDVVDLSPQLLEFAERWQLVVADDVVSACQGLPTTTKPQAPIFRRREILAAASRCGKPENLPQEFIDLLAKELAK